MLVKSVRAPCHSWRWLQRFGLQGENQWHLWSLWSRRICLSVCMSSNSRVHSMWMSSSSLFCFTEQRDFLRNILHVSQMSLKVQSNKIKSKLFPIEVLLTNHGFFVNYHKTPPIKKFHHIYTEYCINETVYIRNQCIIFH